MTLRQFKTQRIQFANNKQFKNLIQYSYGNNILRLNNDVFFKKVFSLKRF